MKSENAPVKLPPPTHPTLVPPLLSLLPEIIESPGFPVPPNPVSRIPVRGSRVAAITFEEALFKSLAYHPLLLYAVAKPLVKRGRREGFQRAVKHRLFLAPLPFQGMG